MKSNENGAATAPSLEAFLTTVLIILGAVLIVAMINERSFGDSSIAAALCFGFALLGNRN